MNAFHLINIATAGLALLVAGAAAAQDAPPAVDPLQARHMDSEARSAWREQQQERVRNMTPEERALMRDTSADGRARMENRNGEGARERRRDGSGQGGGYGQGYQNRQGQDGGGGMGGGRGGRGGR